MNISIDLTARTPDYAMFTDLGNAAVHAIVEKARADRMTWSQTHRALSALAEQEQFAEAMDTMVRECVYDALGIDDEPFYVR
jgi:hypothetical protein